MYVRIILLVYIDADPCYPNKCSDGTVCFVDSSQADGYRCDDRACGTPPYPPSLPVSPARIIGNRPSIQGYLLYNIFKNVPSDIIKFCSIDQFSPLASVYGKL